MSNQILEIWKKNKTKDLILNSELKRKRVVARADFTNHLKFGTAGIRALMGVGTNKLNIHTVFRAANGYVDYLLAHKPEIVKKGIVIAYDNRHNSPLFSEVIANVLVSKAIKVYFFENNRIQPTPVVSYTIRKLELGGGVVVTASHNKKEYNGIKLYNEDGCQLIKKETDLVQGFMAKHYPVYEDFDYSSKFKAVSSKVINLYIDDILEKVRLRDKDTSKLKVVFSAQNGTTGKIASDILAKMDINYTMVKSQEHPNADFKGTKNPNPEVGSAFQKAKYEAYIREADIAFACDPDGDRLGMISKFQRRYKYFTGNEIATLYLDYKLKQLKKADKLPKNAYIVTTNVSSNLPKLIARKYKVNVFETDVGFKNIGHLIKEKGDDNFIFAYEESLGFIVDSHLTHDKDGLQMLVALVEMANYYKTQNIDLAMQLKKIYKLYQAHRAVSVSKHYEYDKYQRLFKRIKKLKAIGKDKIVNVEDYRRGRNPRDFLKITLKSGTWFALRPSGTEDKFKIYIEVVGNKGKSIVSLVAFEKEITETINDNVEQKLVKIFTPKLLTRYLIFTAILAVLLYVVFSRVYSAPGAGGIFSYVTQIINLIPRGAWLSVLGYAFFFHLMAALLRMRLTRIQGHKTKLRHWMVGNLLGFIISFITPFSIGGDIFVYWYMRKKGVPRHALLSTMVMTVIIYQIGLILQVLIVSTFGSSIYRLAFNDPESGGAALGLLIGGIILGIIIIFFMTGIGTSSRFQMFILRNIVAFFEWIPFFVLADSKKVIGHISYELRKIRTSFRLIWKNRLHLFEFFFYEIAPKFIIVFPILFSAAGLITDVPNLNSYFTQIAANNIIQTANSLSFTPGSTGIKEYLTLAINSQIYDPNALDFGNLVLSDAVKSQTTASAADLTFKLLYVWPMLGVSLILLLVTSIREKRKDRQRAISKNKFLRSISKFTHNSSETANVKVSKSLIAFWIALPLTLILIFLFIPI